MSTSALPQKAYSMVKNYMRLEVLLGVLRPDGVGPADMTRHHYLSRLVCEGDQLEKLATHDAGRVESQRKARVKLLRSVPNGDKTALLHALRGLALIHWEWAQELDDGGNGSSETARDCYLFANLVWRLILRDRDFWPAFSESFRIDAGHLTEVKNAVYSDLLNHHLDRMQNLLRDGSYECARFHAERIEEWKVNGSVDSAADLQVQPADVGLSHSEEEAKEVSELAAGVLKKWANALRGRAREQLKRLDEADSSGPAVSQNFAGALEIIDPALMVLPSNYLLLSFSIKQRTAWSYDLARQKHFEEASAVIGPACQHARTFAENFLSELTPEEYENNLLDPDYEMVSTAFLAASQFEGDNARRAAWFQEAKRWGGGNTDLELHIRLTQVRDLLEEGDVDEALSLLNELGARHADHRQVKVLKGNCCFRKGISLANDAVAQRKLLTSDPGQFLSAFQKNRDSATRSESADLATAHDYLRQSAELASPEERPIIEGQMHQIKTLVEEFPYQCVLGSVDAILTEAREDLYELSLSCLESIPKHTQAKENAQHLAAAVYFRWGMAAAEAMNFSLAYDRMLEAQRRDKNEVIRDYVEQFATLKKDENSFKLLAMARLAYRNSNLYEARDYAQSIDRNFSHYNQVRNLLSAIYFFLGIDAVRKSQNLILAPEPSFKKQRPPKIMPAEARLNNDPAGSPALTPEARPSVSKLSPIEAKTERQMLQLAISDLEKSLTYEDNESVRQQLNDLRQVLEHGGFRTLQRRNRGIQIVNESMPDGPLDLLQAYELLRKLEEAVELTDGDPQIAALRDQIKNQLQP